MQDNTMIQSLRRELTDQQVDDLRGVDLMGQVHLSPHKDDVRHELHISPPVFLGLDERKKDDDSVMKLHVARDERCLKLPHLKRDYHRTFGSR